MLQYSQRCYHFSTKTTIAGAGRLVIPKCLCGQFHFGSGTTVEITAENNGLYLRLPQTTSRLIGKDGVLVQEAGNVSPLDATAFINEQRDTRARQNLPHLTAHR